MYSNKSPGVSFTARLNKYDKPKQSKEQSTLDPSTIKLQKSTKNAIITIPTQTLKYGHFVMPDKQPVETPVTKGVHNWPKAAFKQSADNSPPLTVSSQLSVGADSGRPPTALKKSAAASHAKNSMSTHIKKNSYFHTKPDDMQDDLDEFPQHRQRMTDMKNSKQHVHYDQHADDDSSVSKYNEYKKIYFHDANRKHADSESGKHRPDKQQKKKTEYLASAAGPAAIKFDVLSDRADAPRSEAKNVIDKIVNKHLRARDTQPVVEAQPDPEQRSPDKSCSLLSLEHNDGQRNKRRADTSLRNDSYEVMELKSFNEVKHTDEEDKYADSGLYGVFEQALLGNNNVDDRSRHSINDGLTDSMERVDTYGSNVSDSNLSPRSKQICKIVKQVKDSFKLADPSVNTNNDFYRIGKCIGKGAFGKVHLAVQKLTQSLVAIKSINKQYLLDDASKRKVMQEVYILKKIRHCNVVQFYETFETEKYILLVMEL